MKTNLKFHISFQVFFKGDLNDVNMRVKRGNEK